MMADSFHDHVGLEALEGFVFGELPEDSLAPVEEHLLVCETCRQTVSELDVFARLFRHAGDGVSAAFVHATTDGPITLEIRALPGSQWSARFSGNRLEGQAVFGSAREAYAHLRRSFAEMYLQHLCTAECGEAA
jgi:anti-sigma factor RsiW